MQPRPLLTILVALFPACTKEAIEVGNLPDNTLSTGGNTTVGSLTGGAAAISGSAGGMSGTGGQSGATGIVGDCQGPRIFARDTNNYNIESSISLLPVTVKALSDLTFDWSNATADLRGRAVVPATDIAMVAVWVFYLNLKGLQTKLSNDSIVSTDVATLPLVYYPSGGKLSATLSELTLMGTPVALATLLSYFDPALYPPATTSYAMMVYSGTDIGGEPLMIQAIQLDSTVPATTVAMRPDSTTMTFAADLQSLSPIAVVPGQAALSLDFGNMIKNALGNVWDSSYITSAVIGHYTESAAELENSFPNLDRVATDFYQGAVGSGTVVDLASLTTVAGQHFAGIDGTGTWLLGLFCDTCGNPSPWYLTILRPCKSAP